jgi:hypothetical protein
VGDDLKEEENRWYSVGFCLFVVEFVEFNRIRMVLIRVEFVGFDLFCFVGFFIWFWIW